MTQPGRERALLFAITASLAAACTSEATIGSWHTSGSEPLSHDDGTSPPSESLGAAGAAQEPSAQDAGAPAVDVRVHGPLCLRNPSLDGLPHAGALAPDTWWPAEAWDLCWYGNDDYPPGTQAQALQISAVTEVSDTTTVDTGDGMPAMAGALLPPTHGSGYLQLDTLRGLPERTSQMMCAVLEAGVTYNFAIDLASRNGQRYADTVIQPGVLEIYGANTPCGHAGEPLWRSPPLTSAWQTLCVGITPASDVSTLTLQTPVIAGQPSAVLVDNIRLDPSCGPSVVP